MQFNDIKTTHLGSVFLVSFLLWLEPLLICNELLFHEKPIFHTLQLQQPQLAFGVWCDVWKLGAKSCCSSLFLELFPYPWRRYWRFPFLLLVIRLQYRQMPQDAAGGSLKKQSMGSFEGLIPTYHRKELSAATRAVKQSWELTFTWSFLSPPGPPPGPPCPKF